MPGRTLAALSQDEALPALARALDTRPVLPLLLRAAGRDPADSERLVCQTEVLSYKPGRRATIRYTLTGVGNGSAAGGPIELVGKWYADAAMATRLYGWLSALREGAFAAEAVLRVPTPLLLDEAAGLVVLEYLRGDDLRRVLAQDGAERPVRLAAKWLARLHNADALPGAKTSSPLREAAKVDDWRREIAPRLPPEEATRLFRVRAAMHELAGEMDGAAPAALIHRDYYPANVLWDGEAVCVLDLDELRVGDPALDVGHFLAALQNLALRTTGRFDAFAAHGELFLETYLEGSRFDVRSRLPFYQAYTWLKLAAKEARRQRESWQERARALTGLACDAIEAASGEDARGR